MASSKQIRQDKILFLIENEILGTQEELTERLKSAGFDATQATVSRDIGELGLVKTSLANGRAKYISMSGESDTVTKRLLSVFAQAVTGIRVAQNLLVLLTLPGMAQAAASAVDAMKLPDVLGCIAGDDTVFIATESKKAAEKLLKQLNPLCHQNAEERN